MPFWLDMLSVFVNDSTPGMQMISTQWRHALGLRLLLLQCFTFTPRITPAPGTAELGEGDGMQDGRTHRQSTWPWISEKLGGWTEGSLTHSHMRTKAVLLGHQKPCV